jgi:outer membrane protein OmpA-like peptidoglycan-associated protein
VIALIGCAPRRSSSRRSAPPPRMSRIDALSGPHFTFGKSTLTPEGEAKVRQAAGVLNRYPNRYVEVNGYTDSAGTDERNQRLSERRANSVTDVLVSAGVSASRIRTHGYGSSNPVASNLSAEGRAQNRRVEIVLE